MFEVNVNYYQFKKKERAERVKEFKKEQEAIVKQEVELQKEESL